MELTNALLKHSKETPRADQDAEPAPELTDDEKQYYKDARIELAKGELDAIGKFDQYIITLSSGALALSVLFLEKVVPTPAPATFIWILLSWLCFASSLLFTLFSFLLSHWAWIRNRSNLEFRWHKRVDLPVPTELVKLEKNDKWKSNPFNRVLHTINVISFTGFFLGVVLFVMFAFTNRGPK